MQLWVMLGLGYRKLKIVLNSQKISLNELRSFRANQNHKNIKNGKINIYIKRNIYIINPW